MATTRRFIARNGLDNNNNSITNIGASGSTLTMSGGHTVTLTTSGTSSITLPTSGTVAVQGGALGTPTSITLTNATGLPLSTGVTGTLPVANGGTGVTTSTGSGSNVLSTSPTLVTPILGTPTSGTLTNCTGLPISTGVSGLASGVATFLATPTSANLIAVVTDETGSGNLVFSAGPTFTGTVNAANLILSGDLTVNGTTTTVNSNTVNIGDNIIILNSDETGTPSQNAGIEIERGTSTNASLIWDEAADVWEAGLAGSEIPIALTTATQTLTNKTIAAGSNTISGLTNSNLSGTAGITNANLANSTISGVALGGTLGTLTLGTSGTGLSGSTTYNGSGAATFTVTSNATSANTASAIVARDASGNFSAGTITAALSGNATTATTATTAGSITSQANSATITATSANTANQIVLRDASGNFSASSGSFSGSVTWGAGSSVMNSGNPRSLRIGYSGGNYGSASYGVDYSTTSNSHTYAFNDIPSLWEAFDGIVVKSAPAASSGSISWTTVLDARRSNSSLLFKGNTVLDSANYTSYSPSLTGSGASGTWGINITGNAATATSATTAGSITSQANSATITATSANTANQIVLRDASGNFSAGTITATLSGNATTATNISGYSGTYWTSNNDGAGSGLDADTVDGLQVHTGTNNAANQIVRTDGNGYIQAGWINTTSGDNGTTAIDRVYASSDGYIRYYTPANFRTVLNVPTRTGGDASGTWGINITGNAATATSATSASSASSAATLTTARNINGVSFNGSADITVTAAAGTLSGSTLASGVTASSLTSVGTLSSLIVSGNFTVDTNTLFVDATNNRVGIGTTTPVSTFDIRGTAGQLFSVTDSLTGVLMSVNDVSGLPILEVTSSNVVTMGTYGQNALVVNGTTVGFGLASGHAAPVHISGGTAMSGSWNRTAMLQGTYPVLGFYSTQATKYAGIGYDSTTGFRMWTNSSTTDISAGTVAMTISNSGVIGNATWNGASISTTYTDAKVTSVNAGTAISVSATTGAVTVNNTGVTSITGTSNQVTASASTGGVTLSLPQSIHTGALVQFSGIGAGTAGVATEIRATGEITAWYGSSDIRLKENIQPLTDVLEKIIQIRGVEFDWTKEHMDSRGGEDGYFVRKHQYGVIAQEVEPVFPHLVNERQDGTKVVDYHHMSAILIEAVKQLYSKIETLEKKINGNTL